MMCMTRQCCNRATGFCHCRCPCSTPSPSTELEKSTCTTFSFRSPCFQLAHLRRKRTHGAVTAVSPTSLHFISLHPFMVTSAILLSCCILSLQVQLFNVRHRQVQRIEQGETPAGGAWRRLPVGASLSRISLSACTCVHSPVRSSG